MKQFSPEYLKVSHQVSLRLVCTDTRTQQVDQVPAFLAVPTQIGGIVSFITVTYLLWMRPCRPDVEFEVTVPGWDSLYSVFTALAATFTRVCHCNSHRNQFKSF